MDVSYLFPLLVERSPNSTRVSRNSRSFFFSLSLSFVLPSWGRVRRSLPTCGYWRDGRMYGPAPQDSNRYSLFRSPIGLPSSMLWDTEVVQSTAEKLLSFGIFASVQKEMIRTKSLLAPTLLRIKIHSHVPSTYRNTEDTNRRWPWYNMSNVNVFL